MKVAETPPAYCSACFLSKPQARHVDFDVAFDGPTIQPDAGPMVAIDDLIVCEECLCAAAAHVGLSDQTELVAQVEQLQDANRVLAEKLRGLEDYASRMEAAVAAKPQSAGRQRATAKAAR